VTASHRALHVSSGKPHAALFYLEQVMELEHGASFEAEDAAGTHLNAACALGQLRQYNEAISHCRCALAMLRKTEAARASHHLTYDDGNDDARDDFATTRPAPEIQSQDEPTDHRTVRALVQLAGLHEAAGNFEAALGAWLR
jgi:tetratricopeptide (TPR) repeat protein